MLTELTPTSHVGYRGFIPRNPAYKTPNFPTDLRAKWHKQLGTHQENKETFFFENGMKVTFWDDSVFISLDEESLQVQVEDVMNGDKSINNVKPEYLLSIIQRVPWSIKYLEDKTHEACLVAVRSDPWTIKYIQTEDLCLEAVRRDPRTLNMIKDQTERVCLEAIKTEPRAIKYVRHPSVELCLEAISRDPWSVLYIKKPTYRMKSLALEADPELQEWLGGSLCADQ